MQIQFVAAAETSQVLAVMVQEERQLAGLGAGLDAAASGALSKAMSSGRFKGAANSSLNVLAPAGIDAGAVLLVGAGAADKFDDLAVEAYAATAYAAVKMSGAESGGR